MAINISALSNASILPSLSTIGQIKDATPVVTAQSGGTTGVGFADFLSEAMANTVATDSESKTSDIGMLLGEVQDLHTVGLTSAKADIMLNLTVQIRDRVVEAYQEVMRMQI